jgi:chitinase
MEYSPAPFAFGLPPQRRQLNASAIVNGTIANGTSDYVALNPSPKGCHANTQAVKNLTAVHVLEFRYARDGIHADRSEVGTAVRKLRDYLGGQPNCESTTMLAYFRSAVVGFHVGAAVLNADADAVVKMLINAFENTGEVSALSSEVCRENTPLFGM